MQKEWLNTESKEKNPNFLQIYPYLVFSSNSSSVSSFSQIIFKQDLSRQHLIRKRKKQDLYIPQLSAMHL